VSPAYPKTGRSQTAAGTVIGNAERRASPPDRLPGHALVVLDPDRRLLLSVDDSDRSPGLLF
jgi:hypothetical protein